MRSYQLSAVSFQQTGRNESGAAAHRHSREGGNPLACENRSHYENLVR